MRVLISPDKFKGTLTAAQAAAAMAEGVRRAHPHADIALLPIADGGDGTLEAALAAGFTEQRTRVNGPRGAEVEARWALRGGTAVIETAAASGLLLTTPSVESALYSHSYGSGQLIAAALDARATQIVIGLGGSAMTDGGAGALQALGLALYSGDGTPLRPGIDVLSEAARLEVGRLDPRLAGVALRIATDVDNHLYGPDGAACVFGPQKGADAAAVRRLDEALRHWAAVLSSTSGRDVNVAGAGAAGGFAAGFLAFTGARLERGFDLVADLVGFDAALAEAELLVTGEGRVDAGSAHGKAPLAAAGRARDRGVPVALVAGDITVPREQLTQYGIVAAASLMDLAADTEDAFARAADYVTRATQRALEAIQAARGGGPA
ncbi:glycerate kinase [Citricoccus sp. NPDC055426]|uniref:glycerate kinase n=1 Tax=Citricoccus sp. NPDC055426 TaxID=3155536 RepID=UPI00341E431A